MHEAIDAYRANNFANVNPRFHEAQLLIKAANRLSSAQQNIDDVEAFEEALLYNRKLWTVFASSLTRQDNHMEKALKENILSLAAFIFKHSNSLSANIEADKLSVLIDINRQIAAGLRNTD